MKKFSILFTLILFVSSAFGQLVTANFDNSSSILTTAPNVTSATLTANSTISKDADCVTSSPNDAKKLPNSPSPHILTIVVTPDATHSLVITGIKILLRLSVGDGTALVTVGGTSFGTAPVTNGCTNFTFSGLKESLVLGAPVTITIEISGYSNSQTLTFDDLIIEGSVVGAVLPVELAKFNVKKTEQSVMLSWATASEKNNDHFDIQKSINGTQFQTIGQVKGSGTNLSGAIYNFEDKNPSVGIAYYRLKQVDIDGKYAYTAVRSILFGKSKITVFSSIAKEKISLTVSDDQIVPYDIINLNGQTVLAGKAIGQHTIDISTLHSGMYFIRTEGGEVTRFVKD